MTMVKNTTDEVGGAEEEGIGGGKPTFGFPKIKVFCL